MKEETAVVDVSEEDSVTKVDEDETATDKTETDDKSESAEETDGEIKDDKSDESDDQDTEKKGLFNEEQQEVFNKRVGKEIEKRKALEQKATELEAKLSDVTTKSNPDVLAASANLSIPPAYLNESEAKLLAEYDKWVEVRKFCRAHKDGYIGTGGNDKDMSEEYIRGWLEEASDQLLEIAPEAKMMKRDKARQLAEDAALGRKLRQERSTAVQKKNADLKKPAVASKTSSGMAPATTKTSSRIMSGQQFQKVSKEKGSDEAVKSFFSGMVTSD